MLCIRSLRKLEFIHIAGKGAEKGINTRSIHEGRHLGSVNEKLAKKMDAVKDAGKINNWTQEQYKQGLQKIIRQEHKSLKTGDRILNKNYRPGAKNE